MDFPSPKNSIVYSEQMFWNKSAFSEIFREGSLDKRMDIWKCVFLGRESSQENVLMENYCSPKNINSIMRI